MTFVTADGETEIGQLSAAVTVVDKTVNGQIAVTDIPTGGSFVTSRRLWMTAVGGTVARLVATIANNTATTATISVADTSLGAEAPTSNTTANPELNAWIPSARQICETFVRRRLIDQVLDWKLDGDSVPTGTQVLRLPFGNVTAIGSITYVDANGVTQPWSSSEYRTDLPTGEKCSRGRIEPAYGYQWPSTRGVIAAMTIRMTAGYGATRASVPEALKVGMKALISHWDRTREAVNVGNIVNEVPMGVKYSWSPFRTF
ncbi:MAG TPA: hypothetical protein VEC39_05325 [Vicinamibacterales bacterium]|nr:hypothetical protein [Vicinamibacterales bacterium]